MTSPITKKAEKKIYSVTEITRDIRVRLEEGFRQVWVEGEISNFKLHTSGHMYFSLKDSSSVLKCAMFRRANEKLSFQLKDGMQALCLGTISVYEARGDYQLIVEEVEPKGVGALQLKFQQLKERLFKEGLFDEAHKVPIPYLPYRIGIVTSPTGAAIRDILNVSRRRFSNIEILIYPVLVQGETAGQEIADAIATLNRWNTSLPEDRKVDVLIVGRGGGSLEDLWAFNEEVVARAIWASEIPVISAVGHEIDYVIADFVADVRAPTPSAAAEMVIPRKEDLVDAITKLRNRLLTALSAKIDLLREQLSRARSAYILRQPLNIIVQYQQRIDDLTKDLITGTERLIEDRQQGFRLFIEKLETLSPLGILNRGYSITTNISDGKIIRSARQVSRHERVRTLLGKGSFVSSVEEIDDAGSDDRQGS